MILHSLFFINLCLAITLTQLNHPLAVILLILVQTIMTCFMTGLLTQSLWFSYILFLVFLGGMLVLFIYITSLASNEMFVIPIKLLITWMILFSLIFNMSLILDFFIPDLIVKNNDMNPNLSILIPQIDSTFSIMKLYNQPTSTITILLVLYLFLSLIAIVKITDIFRGPMRKKI